jgi:hypothetical protein
LKEVFEARWKRYKDDLETAGDRLFDAKPGNQLLDARQVLLQAELELTDKPADRIAAHEKHVKLAQEIDTTFEEMSKNGKLRVYEYMKVKAARLAGEIDLLRAKAGGKPSEEQTGAIKKLLQARRDALCEEVEDRESRVKGFPNVDLLEASVRLLQAELELTEKGADRIAAHEKHLKVATVTDDFYESFTKNGKYRLGEYKKVKAARLAAETDLLREKAGSKPSAEHAAEIKKLLEARRDTLREEVEYRMSRLKIGLDDRGVDLLEAFGRLLQVELDLADKPADRIAAHKRQLEAVKVIEETFKSMKSTRAEVNLETKAARLEAEIGLLREQMK